MKRYVLLGVSILCTLGIFAMSLSVGSDSAALSSPVTIFVETVLKGIFPRYDLTFEELHAIVRKLAHMGEYGALGMSYMLTARAWKYRIGPVLLAGTLVAFADEGLQAFVPDRGPSVLDAVCFDLPGFLLGVAAIVLACRLFRQKNPIQKDVS